MRALIILAAVLLSGCATTSVPPAVPPQLLACQPQPRAPLSGTQRDVGLYVIDLAAAGDDCRSKLGAVRLLLEPAP